MRKCYLPQLLHITAWSDCLSVLSCAVWAHFLKRTQAGANGKMRNATSILPDFAINYFWRFSGGGSSFARGLPLRRETVDDGILPETH